MWHDFEVQHGNEDTFREMLRIKRSVQAQFNTQVRILFSQVKPIVLSLSGIVFSALFFNSAPLFKIWTALSTEYMYITDQLRFLGRKLPTYPSPKSTLTLTSHSG